jgi:hypothetical protein
LAASASDQPSDWYAQNQSDEYRDTRFEPVERRREPVLFREAEPEAEQEGVAFTPVFEPVAEYAQANYVPAEEVYGPFEPVDPDTVTADEIVNRTDVYAAVDRDFLAAVGRPLALAMLPVTAYLTRDAHTWFQEWDFFMHILSGMAAGDFLDQLDYLDDGGVDRFKKIGLIGAGMGGAWEGYETVAHTVADGFHGDWVSDMIANGTGVYLADYLPNRFDTTHKD